MDLEKIRKMREQEQQFGHELRGNLRKLTRLRLEDSAPGTDGHYTQAEVARILGDLEYDFECILGRTVRGVLESLINGSLPIEVAYESALQELWRAYALLPTGMHLRTFK